jgi:hypothetical protein
VRKTRSGWQARIEQSNGKFTSFSGVLEISDEEGQAAFETAKSQA